MQEENSASQGPSDMCTELVEPQFPGIHMIAIAQTAGNWLILTWKDQE